MEKVIDVTAGVVWKGGEFLITRRRNDDPVIPGLWEFPGGKIEDGEEGVECLARELREELEIDVVAGEVFLVSEHKYPSRTIRLHFFTAQYKGGEIKLNDHSEAKWITLDELDRYDFAPADIPVLNSLRTAPLGKKKSPQLGKRAL